MRKLRIQGARENTLKNLSLEIPHDELVVVTGLSGSGKSSLAFDTVYAEGQRRYIETFSSYTRQFFDKVKKPAIDLVENVRPAIAIQQRTRITGSRSTVGSLTDINDYLKIIWSNLAKAHCPVCSKELEAYSPRALAQHLIVFANKNPHTSFLVCAKKSLNKKTFSAELRTLRALGFARWFKPETASILNFDEELPGPNNLNLILVLDRFSAEKINQRRLSDSVQQAYNIAGGKCLIINGFEMHEFSDSYCCPEHQINLGKPRPGLFSYNHPLGACAECKGFGKVLKIDPELCVPNPSLSIADKAVQCWSGPGRKGELSKLLKFCKAQKIPVDIAWAKLSAEQQKIIFEHKSKEYRGVLAWFKRLERKVYKMHVRVFLSKYRTQIECPTCAGTRLKPQALAYRINGKTIAAIWNMPISDARAWLANLQDCLKSSGSFSREISDLFKLTLSRLGYLVELGLPYLSLNRQARSLSGGETQRVNLSTALGSELVSTQFVLDEPSVGLHPRDTQNLIRAMRKLQSRKNSLLVVEHDLDCIKSADQIIQLGPQAGDKGGELIFNDASSKWAFPHQKSLIPAQTEALLRNEGSKFLRVHKANARNLKSFDLKIPLERFVCLCGVSGSGKSTLVSEVIVKAFENRKNGRTQTAEENRVEGLDQLASLSLVDQSPLSKTPRANVATYCGIWDEIRNLLAKTEDAQARGLNKSSFSFNVDGGRCPDCKGAGFIREDMQFLSDVYIPCELCLGKRFQSLVLEVQYKELSVFDLLNMSVESCATFFADIPKICEASSTLSKLGLGYLRLGHPLSELSGGEAQRLKLVPFIQEGVAKEGSSLLIFDEPTTGLHWQDVQRLIELFSLLIQKGHSVLCIEHNPLLLLSAQWLIDLGPEGGEGGGQILLQGAPQLFLEASNAKNSYTAKHLQDFVCEPVKSGSSVKSTLADLEQNFDQRYLFIKGAREHNLKDLSLKVPLDKLVAITGVSGSGKSTIAKDIIYAEGQRRYLDCLSPYARQFIHELKKPNIQSIHNVRPTICVHQHTFRPGHLSTVGSMSEVYNFLRLLYAKTATQYCPKHPQQAIRALSPQLIAEDLKSLNLPSVRILAPIVKAKKGSHRAVFQRALEREALEVRVDGVFGKARDFELGLDKGKVHSIEFSMARFNPKNLQVEWIAEAIQDALTLGGGNIIVCATDFERTYSLERACPICRTGFFKPDPEDLSFHSKRGRCKRCQGTGLQNPGQVCSACQGSRLSSFASNLRLSADSGSGKNIFEISLLSLDALQDFLGRIHFDQKHFVLAEPVLKEISSRLKVLISFGLNYLELNRSCDSLSNGELQRLRIASAMGSALSGVMYIFDEPSAGLHPLDNQRVLQKFNELIQSGNSVLIIEHDPATIKVCEDIVDVGPGGGSQGGAIVFSGAMKNFLKDSDSTTAKALRGELRYEPEIKTSSNGSAAKLKIQHADKNNIKNLNLELPLNSLISIVGVSGAGKSSLVHGIISDAIHLGTEKEKDAQWVLGDALVTSALPLERCLLVDQSPIGKTSRSTPASYLGVWDEIRKIFGSSLEAKSRGWSASYFSYNSGKGRCPVCKGQGQIKLEMSFLADASILCEACRGKRFQEDAESVRYLGLSISEALNLTFEEARQKFANHRKIHQPLLQAAELGLGYLTLGQASNTLSGGEAQRIKLVSELSSTRRGHTLYLLDEPTTGLHKADVVRLVKVLRSLVALGNTVIVIEHDQDLILGCDYVVEMGPGPAEAGGKVIFQGPPQELYTASTPWGQLLRMENNYISTIFESKIVLI